MTDVFRYSDYKRFLSALIHESPDPKFRPQLIRAMGCQKSFFSQMLSGPLHLTPDHAALLVEHLGMDELASEYFITLVNLARAGGPALRQRLKKRLTEIRNRASQPTERLKWPSIRESEQQSVYYSSFIFAAVHIIVSLPHCQSAEAIAARLAVPIRRVNEVLDWLIGARLIEKTRSGFAVTARGLHLGASSHLNEMHHTHWRNRALANLQQGDDGAIHYSATFTMTREDFAELKARVMAFVEQCTRLIAPSNPEEIYVLGVDAFRL